jgi:hypothetical protein
MSSSLTRLNSALSEDQKAEIIARFWRKRRAEIRIEDYTTYFQFYQKSCDSLYLGLRCEAKALVAESHDHVLVIVDLIWSYLDDNQGCKRIPLRKKLEQLFSHLLENSVSHEKDIKLNNSINLALRLWLTVDIREEVFAPATFPIQWDDDSTLQEFVWRQFPSPKMTTTLTDKETVTLLDSDFTAGNLRRIGGINIDWTYHLNEHLSFDRELRRLKVYTLKKCLYDQKHRLVLT